MRKSPLYYILHSLILTLLVAFTSCHFGDDEDGLEALAKQKRALSYTVQLAFSPCGESNDSIVDKGIGGLFVNFGDSADIAILGKEFQSVLDTTGSAAWPSVGHLSYQEHIHLPPVIEGDYSKLTFDYDAYGKHSNGFKYATCIQYFYPYSLAFDTRGHKLKARVDSIPFNFTGQDGTLDGLRRKYYPALATSQGVCTKSNVVMYDSAVCLIGHNHDSLASQVVLFDPKVAVLRMSLVVAAQRDFPLLEYLVRIQSSEGKSYYVDRIELLNRADGASGINKTLLNLRTGHMESTSTSLPYLVLSDEYKFWRHRQIELDSPEPISDDLSTWGTLVYASIPCVQEGWLDTDWLVTVYLTELGSSPVVTKKYYGTLQPVKMCEGGYYLTSPVLLYEAMEAADHPAWICRIQ